MVPPATSPQLIGLRIRLPGAGGYFSVGRRAKGSTRVQILLRRIPLLHDLALWRSILVEQGGEPPIRGTGDWRTRDFGVQFACREVFRSPDRSPDLELFQL